MTRKALLVALLSFALLMAALVTRNGDLALMALPLLAYLGAGILAAPVLEQIRLGATRAVNVNASDRGTTVDVRVALRNEGASMLSLQVADPPQPGMTVTEGALCQWLALAAGEAGEFKYSAQADRGSFRWKTLHTVASDPLGLFECSLELPAGSELQIRPKVRRFRPIPLRPDSTIHAPGSIPARLGGNGTDFWGVREYHPGDPLRRLDWRLTARHPRKFYTKEFEQEEIADISLILDARNKVNLQVGEDSLIEHTVGAAASLAEVLLHQGHRVSLLIFGEQMTTVYPGYGKVQLNRILRRLAQVRPGSTPSNFNLDYIPLRRFPSRSLVVIISPLTPGDWPIFPRLRAHGNQGLLICPDAIDFALRTIPEDMVSQLGLRAARVERRLELRKIAQLGIRVIDWQVEQPLSILVQDAFRPVRGQRARAAAAAAEGR
jgi:uncharacterized protein (DUF58 family)